VIEPVVIEAGSAGALWALALWGGGAAAQARVAKALGCRLPAPGRAAGDAGRFALRLEPALWWIGGAELDAAAIETALAGDGALTAIGGGVRRVRLTGPGWRGLLMIGGVFDAEAPAFAPGCVASSLIEHVQVRLHVVAEDACEAYVPASHAEDLLQFWERGAPCVAVGLGG
jgi:heterotetrameric sarcosine oxidase gamma subunit